LKKQSGFTLFELLISIAIVAILAVIVVPTGKQLLIEQRRSVAEKRVIAALNFARLAAIHQHDYVMLCPSDNKKNCRDNWQLPLMVFTDKDDKAAVNADDHVLRHFEAQHYGKLSLTAFPTKRYFRFSPNGFTDNQNGTFHYCYQEKGWQLVLNRAGRIRKEEQAEC
jgi:prepilin-type N-terminal cleavage/methylation domain-containing protein